MRKEISLIGLLFLLLAGCAQTSPIGVTAPYDPTEKRFDNGTRGHHHVVTKHIIFDYDYDIGEGAHSITLKGTTTCNGQNVTDWEQANIRVSVFIISQQRKVIAHKDFEIGDFYDNTSFCERREFDITMAQVEDPQSISWGYNISMRQ